MTTAPVLQLRALEDSDEDAVLGLLGSALAGGPTGSRTSEFFRWKHRRSPFGRSPGLVATHDERIVGVRLFLPWTLVAGERTYRAVRAVDTATHPDYQRQGIFRRLTLALLEDLEAEDRVDLVFNTPNADSRPGYLRMGWTEVDQLPIRISPVHLWTFARGMRGASRANASGGAGAVAPRAGTVTVISALPRAGEVLADRTAVEQLISEAGGSDRLHTALSADYLQWRYADAPDLDYRAVVVSSGRDLVGLGLGRMRTRAGLTEFTLGDVLVRRGDTSAAGKVLRAARRSGADHVAVHAAPGTEVGAAALRSGYLTAPGGGIGLVANPRRPMAVDPLAASSWRLTLGDLEVF